MESNAKMTVETRDPRFKDVVGNAVDITLVGSGYITGQCLHVEGGRLPLNFTMSPT